MSFDAPAVFDETGGEVIEQLRMRGARQRAEIVGRVRCLAENASARCAVEMTRAVWDFGVGDPIGKLEASITVAAGGLWLAEDREEAARDLGAEGGRPAADHDAHVDRRASLTA